VYHLVVREKETEVSTTFRKYDLWQTEREAAEVVEPFGVRVLRSEGRVSQKPTVMIWRPKASKPEAHYSFRTVEARESYVTRWLGEYGRSQEAKATAKAEAKAVAASAPKVKVGTIFVHSWGWEQTNVDFYEVVATHGQMVDVRPIASEEVPGSQGFMSASVKAVPGAFITKTYKLQDAHGNYKTYLTKRVQHTSEGTAYLSFDYGWCGLWSGAAMGSSWYA
jgi:hypothetical protein